MQSEDKESEDKEGEDKKCFNSASFDVIRTIEQQGSISLLLN